MDELFYFYDYLAKANSPKYSVIANMAAVVGGHSVQPQGHNNVYWW